MSNAKQKAKATWKLIFFSFSLSITVGSLKQYYMRKLFTKCLSFQIDGFFFIALYIYIHTLWQNLNKCSFSDWDGLEIFVKMLLMEQRCVGSTFKLFLSKHRIATKTTYA